MTSSSSLRGRRIIVTRPEPENGPLSDAIRKEGGQPLHLPLNTIEPVPFRAPRPAEITAWDTIVFTSANGVRHFVAGVSDETRRELARHRGIAVIGPATARALTDAGCSSSLVATEHVAESLASELEPREGTRILWPRGNLARAAFPDAMRLTGALLTELVVYRTVAVVPENAAEILRDADAITFTSPSGVNAWAAAFGAPPIRVACIGPVTAAAAAARGFEVTTIANPYTLTGLMSGLRRIFSSAAGHGSA